MVKPWKITSKGDGLRFYLYLTNDEIKDIRLPKKCTTGEEVMKQMRDYYFVRENGKRKVARHQGGFYFVA